MSKREKLPRPRIPLPRQRSEAFADRKKEESRRACRQPAEAGGEVCVFCGEALHLIEVRGHTECAHCHRLYEGCCEGGPG